MTVRACSALLAALWAVSGVASAQSFGADVAPLLEASCLQCHGERTVTPLNLARLEFDLADHETFRTWERVYERVEKGEMPPEAAPRPDAALVETALGSLKRALVDANLAARGAQRTQLRRLTRLEYSYTIQDLLGIDAEIATELSLTLPAEADSGGFNTVGAYQSMSPLHMRAYLAAADRALDVAIPVGPPPPVQSFEVQYAESETMYRNSLGEQAGAGIVLQLDDAYATFHAGASTYCCILHSESQGFEVLDPGRYRITVTAYPYQADTPVTLTMYRGRMSGLAASLDRLLGTWDLVGDGPRTVELTPFLHPGDLVSPSLADADAPPGDRAARYSLPGRNIRDYKGEGVALKTMTIDGPLFDSWPPPSARQLLPGVEFDEDGEIRLTKDPYAHVVDIVAAFAPRAFRRPLQDGELEAYAGLARPLLDAGRPFLDAARIALRAVLGAPPFLYHAGRPGALDDFALATRLSYFLWRSMPDAELLDVAREGGLSDPTVLAQQVDRMLDDARTERFVKDFAGQAYRLYELRATAPDPGLYPDYDDGLARAMARETELFLAELIAEDRGAGNLIDAEFTFVNRRLAEHYGIAGVEGQQVRKVTLPADSPRGGLLTQASIHKITANGTTTSPIPRGQLRPDEPAGAAGPAAAARRGGPGARHAGDDDDSRAVGRAPLQPGMRELPPGHRPARIRARVVRPDRRLPHDISGLGRRDGPGRRTDDARAVHRGTARRSQRSHAGRRCLRGDPGVQAVAARSGRRSDRTAPRLEPAGLLDRRRDRVRRPRTRSSGSSRRGGAKGIPSGR